MSMTNMKKRKQLKKVRRTKGIKKNYNIERVIMKKMIKMKDRQMMMLEKLKEINYENQ